tara:strand:+ start:144 stop:650 length:507 start_codon:yes stop_codon:yes gene_type:complete
MKPTLLNNILPHQTNQKIIKHLANHHWFVAWDNKMDRLERLFSSKNSGFNLVTMDKGKPQLDSVLNVYGEMIFDIIIERLQIKGTLDRVYWNMYLKNSEGDYHQDRPDENCLSALYNLHTTDGGVEIDGKFYGDVESQAKVFKSNTLHMGFGPKKDNVRFNLNLVVRT